MKKIIVALAVIASMVSCSSKTELGTESVYEYYDDAQTQLKSIGNYKPGAEKQLKRSTSGLQLLETYVREEILSPLVESGLDTVLYTRKDTFLDQNTAMNSTPIIFSADKISMERLQKHLSKHPEIMQLFPEDMEFMWSARAEEFVAGKEFVYHLYAVRHARLTINHADIAEAIVEKSLSGEISLMVSMTAQGTEKWKEMTDANLGRSIAITVNKKVYSVPMVRGAISAGRTQISGSFTDQEALDLTKLINAYVLNGEWRDYHENGKLREIRKYEKGEQTGEWSTYDENGKLIKTRGK